ncbi:RNA polymerase sigma-70 factor [Fulvitalea axinellae]|uniref:RNA polymerase sigma-70 factor n=1 Tax=Fulvitalea axinellae TaxID=1182444 RepID=A0AAU9CHV9_9BACT|nr:RNA polymerase sigma-70 factor [Fulvitalea axinellae]
MEKYKNASDRELWTKLREEDPQALDHLIRRHFTALCEFSKYLTHDSHVAEEIVSDVFAQIWFKREQLNITGNVKAYFFTAVKNRSLNFATKPKISKVSIEDSYSTNLHSHMEADSGQRFSELRDAIDSLVEMLPPRRKLIFKMSRYEGLSYREIAKKLEISENTVQNQISEAQKFMASHRSKLMDEDKLVSLAIIAPALLKYIHF